MNRRLPMDDSGAQAKIDALVANFFSAFDNRDGAAPRLADLINCFTDKAARTTTASVIEYYNATLDQYHSTLNAPEIQDLDTGVHWDGHGRAGASWLTCPARTTTGA